MENRSKRLLRLFGKWCLDRLDNFLDGVSVGFGWGIAIAIFLHYVLPLLK